MQNTTRSVFTSKMQSYVLTMLLLLLLLHACSTDWNSFVIEVIDFLSQHLILQQRRSSRSNLERVIIVHHLLTQLQAHEWAAARRRRCGQMADSARMFQQLLQLRIVTRVDHPRVGMQLRLIGDGRSGGHDAKGKGRGGAEERA